MFHKSVRIPLWAVVLAMVITSLMAAAGSAARMDTWEKTSFLLGGAKSAGVILKKVVKQAVSDWTSLTLVDCCRFKIGVYASVQPL